MHIIKRLREKTCPPLAGRFCHFRLVYCNLFAQKSEDLVYLNLDYLCFSLAVGLERICKAVNKKAAEHIEKQ